ncbi:MFS transporter, partial [Actinotalea sp. C106]|uniref:MFS transporter n=1 Tax=Actinotalea sp. C106 TaxID=2908644 RepID=UPI0035ABCE61
HRRRVAAEGLLPPADLPAHSPALRRIAILLTVAFAGQAFGYSVTSAWLPTLLNEERGLDLAASGAVASLFQIAAVIGALGVPVLAARSRWWVPAAVVGALWCSLPLGLLLAPGAYTVWTLLGGIAQGAGFVVIFSIVVRVTRSDREATGMSARIQAGGYLAAAGGPVLAGALHSAAGTWTVPLLAVLVATTLFTTAALLGARTARDQHGHG